MSESQAAGTPLPVPTPEQRAEVNERVRVPRSYTHPVIVQTPDPMVGTAVLLRGGGRLYAFTAAHNVRAETTIRIALPRDAQRTCLDVLDTYVHPQYDPGPDVSPFDLAILELEPTPAVGAGDVRQLYTGGFGRPAAGESPPHADPFVWVVGYPIELATRRADLVQLYQVAFATQIMEVDREQMVLMYPQEEYRVSPDGFSAELGQLPASPRGYSGGGVWNAINPPGVPFDPLRHVKLVGIQTHWSSRTRRVHCVPCNVLVQSLNAFRPGTL